MVKLSSVVLHESYYIEPIVKSADQINILTSTEQFVTVFNNCTKIKLTVMSVSRTKRNLDSLIIRCLIAL